MSACQPAQQTTWALRERSDMIEVHYADIYTYSDYVDAR